MFLFKGQNEEQWKDYCVQPPQLPFLASASPCVQPINPFREAQVQWSSDPCSPVKRHAIHTNKCSLLDLCRPATVLSTLSIKSAVGRSGKSRKGPWSLHFFISMHSPYCWSFNKHTDSSDCIISDPPSYIDMEPIEPDWGAHMMIKPCREREK